VPTTVPPVDTTGQTVLPNADGTELCVLGPPAGTGEVFERKSASVGIDTQTGGWLVSVDLRGDGQAAWNAIAAECFSGAPTCPSSGLGNGRLAIVLDDVIQSAPTVQQPSFDQTVQISGSFTESEARDLAQTLNRGAFPVSVVQQRVETVSPTAGDDSLDAAVFAGLVGVGLTMLYMIAYYRRLAVVIILGLVVWAALVYVLSTWVSRETNYAFTIAGATGVIVSIGVTVDTYIVFFERLKDEVRSGRSLRNAAPRAFTATWRTILAANTVALLSAVVLFVLSVGSVKGFALYLGMTTVCDLVVFYFFTRPALYLLSDTRFFRGREAKSMGIGAAIGGAS
jgi:preprotein translocase subunit SecD